MNNFRDPEYPDELFQTALNILNEEADRPESVERASRLLLASAEMGSSRAQGFVGLECLNGKLFPGDLGAAVKWLELAAQQGLADAEAELGRLYLEGSGVKRDESHGLGLIRSAADKGQEVAQANLGNFYMRSLFGIEQDYNEAIKWSLLAAQKGSIEAQKNCGLIYFSHLSDNHEALKWFRLAAEQGDDEAQFFTGYILAREGRKHEAMKWHRLASEQGDASSQWLLAVLSYDEGPLTLSIREAGRWFQITCNPGQYAIRTLSSLEREEDCLVPDYSEIARLLTLSAQQGFQLAQYYLATMYGNGLGVEKDFTQAIEWLTKSAEQGYTDAQVILAICLGLGLAGPPDYPQSVEWIRRAAENGDDRALLLLDLGVASEENIASGLFFRDESKLLDSIKALAEHGNLRAQVALGETYASGELCVKQDLGEAIKWYKNAADQGNSVARFSLGFLYEFGQGVRMDLAEAKKWYLKSSEAGHEDADERLRAIEMKLVFSALRTRQET